VVERPPAYPVNIGYPARGNLVLLSTLGFCAAWTMGWGVALSELMNDWTVPVPALALGLITTAFARHAWGGLGSRPRVALTSLAVLVPCVALAFTLATRLHGGMPADLFAHALAGFVFGLVGVMVGWLAWWGAVDPLPERSEEDVAVEDAVAVVDCGLCAQNVLPDVRAECPYACGRFFHSGCYRARVAVYSGDPRECAICAAQIN
jgi:hypothetical protein